MAAYPGNAGKVKVAQKADFVSAVAAMRAVVTALHNAAPLVGTVSMRYCRELRCLEGAARVVAPRHHSDEPLAKARAAPGRHEDRHTEQRALAGSQRCGQLGEELLEAAAAVADVEHTGGGVV